MLEEIPTALCRRGKIEKERKELVDVHATIFVEKKSQRYGHWKERCHDFKIGSQAREDVEKLLSTHINLHTMGEDREKLERRSSRSRDLDTYNRDNLADVENCSSRDEIHGDQQDFGVLTKEYGKISVMAQGAMKEKKRFFPNLDDGEEAVSIYAKAAVFYVNSAELLRSNGKIRSSYQQYLYGLFFCEIVDMAATERSRTEKLI